MSSFTSAFLAALKRLYKKRRKSRYFYLDNGTNFFVAVKHLDRDFRAVEENIETLILKLATEEGSGKT